MMKSLTVAALLMAPVAAVAQSPMSASTYVMKAGASDQYEIQSSRLLLTSTTNPRLKTFATMMVRDHTQSTADVKAAAQAAKMTVPPPHLDAMGTRNMAALRAAKGTARDRLYIEQQKAGHQMALKLHQDYAANGSVPSLKAAAAKIVPVVEHHISELASM